MHDSKCPFTHVLVCIHWNTHLTRPPPSLDALTRRCGVSASAQHGKILAASAELDAQCMAAANVIATP